MNNVFKNPVVWAEAAIKHQGVEKATRICQNIKVDSPQYEFFQRALNHIQKVANKETVS